MPCLSSARLQEAAIENRDHVGQKRRSEESHTRTHVKDQKGPVGDAANIATAEVAISDHKAEHTKSFQKQQA
jgi:hypothetical protein